jgi:hypothetical protein
MCGCDAAIGPAHRAQAQAEDAETASALRTYHRFWCCTDLAVALVVFGYLALRLVPFKRLLLQEEGAWRVPGLTDLAILLLGSAALVRSFVHARALRKLSRQR